MNRKHKHKQNKQTNPVPPQKTQEREEKESELKIEERVPEIVSGLIPESHVEIKNDTEVETPNKPKRNRRNKKNEDTDLEEKCSEHTIEVKSSEPIKTKEDTNEKKTTEINRQDSEQLPISRKKKNKNKKNAEKTEAKTSEAAVKSVDVAEIFNIVGKEIQGLKSEDIQKEIISDKLETDNIQPKKKNKNKKNKKSKSESERECENFEEIDKEPNTDSYNIGKSTKPDTKLCKPTSEPQEPITSDKTKVHDADSTGKSKESIPDTLKEEIKDDSSKLKKKNKKKRNDSDRSDIGTVIKPDDSIVMKDAKKEIEVSSVKGDLISKNNNEILDIKAKQNVVKPEIDIALGIDSKIETNEGFISDENKELSQKSKKKNKKKPLETTESEKKIPKEVSSSVLEHTTDIETDIYTEIKSDKKLHGIHKKLDNVKATKLESMVEEKAKEIKCKNKDKNNPPIELNAVPPIADCVLMKSEDLNVKSDLSETKNPVIKCEQKSKNKKNKLLQSDEIKEQTPDKLGSLLNIQSEQTLQPHSEKEESKQKSTKKSTEVLHSDEKSEPILGKVENLLNQQSQQATQQHVEKEVTQIKDGQEINKTVPVEIKSDKISQPKVDKIEIASVIQSKQTTQLPIKIEDSRIHGDKKTEETSSLLQQFNKTESQTYNAPKELLPIFSEKIEKEIIDNAPLTEVKKKKKSLLSIELKSAKEESEVEKPEEMSKPIIQADVMKVEAKGHRTIELYEDNTQKSKNKNKKGKHSEESIKPHSEFIEVPTPSIQDSQNKQSEKPRNTQQSYISHDCKREDSDAGDITPDSIEFQRSISECNMFMDTDNNNTFIEQTPEIPILPIQTLNVPVVIPDTPFIKELENLPSPIKITSKAIPLPDIRKSETVDMTEKTDLKSKVLEVNQDMEELRLSIEKSLAELTCMETSEEIPELIYLQSSIDQNIPPTTSAMDKKIIKNVPQQPKTETTTSAFSSTFDMFPKFKTFEETKKDEQPEKMPYIASETKMLNTVSLASILESPPINVSPLETPLPTSADFPSCPARKDKGKGKSKKNSKCEAQSRSLTDPTTGAQSSISNQQKTETNKSEQKEPESQQQQKKEQSANDKKQTDEDVLTDNKNKDNVVNQESSQIFEPIDNFEDAMTSSSDDVNKSFEIIAEEATTFSSAKEKKVSSGAAEYSKDEEKKLDKKLQNVNPLVSNPKNLLGHPDIPARSNRMDYKKEKSKPPNSRQARVRIKDTISPEKFTKQSKESQTENNPKFVITKPFKNYDPYLNEDYVYKYSFRNVFLPHVCHICKKKIGDVRVACDSCNLFFYCSIKHKDNDRSQHQALCFAVSTIVNLKGEKYIYENSKEVTGMNYRLLRMQMIVSCEKIVKRRLVPWEQEALLYPRMCAEPTCREWRHKCLKDCEACGQISYCKDVPDHFPKNHLRWCKSYSLYQKLVIHQQTKGRLEPRLPTKVINATDFEIPDKINELLATMYEEKIDMDDLQYAALTQLATAPLTAAYSHQVYTNVINNNCANGALKKSSFTLHVVGAELQFEADALNKWEIFFLHLRPDVKELNVVLIGPDLNPSNLPLELLAKIKLCENCRQNNRKVIFNFYDKKLYNEFVNSEEFTFPDIVCAFNPSLNRSLGINGKDSWSATVNSILKLRTPFCVTSYTPEELPKDLARIKHYAAMNYKIITEPSHNPYASIRPDRNFISDDEMPLLFKNYSYAIICGQY